jgi:hypothetical protein
LPNKLKLENGITITTPIDVLKGGTWIAMDTNGRSACLLNGAFVKHSSKKEYRKSRGHIVIEAFKAENFDAYTSSILLDDIEPFTLILIENDGLIELVWDGTNKYIRKLSQNAPLLWSSSTLYSREEHALKEAYFFKSFQALDLNKDDILKIHGRDKNTPFILQHPVLQTVSICQLVYDNQKSRVEYILRNKPNQTPNALSIICD